MKIGSVPNVSFKSVYAVSGSKDQIADLYNGLLDERAQEKALVLVATDIYEGSTGKGCCAKAVREGKEVGFLITGKNIKDVLFMHHGWGSMNGISHHIANFFEIKNDKAEIDNFKAIIQKDWQEDSKAEDKKGE